MPIDITALLSFGLPGLLLGLVIGWLLFRGTAKLEAAQEVQDTTAAQLAAANAEIAQLERDLASARDQVKPLADEVDRLRREKAARKAAPAASASNPASAPAAEGAEAPPAQQGLGWKPGRKLPTFLEAPIGPTDDLSLLKGVGPRLAARLREIGVFYFAQIADWTPEEVKLVDAKLDNFRGRIEKDQLIEQAKLLASGRTTEYEARFGKLGA